MESKNKYETSKIYKIESHLGDKIYIGSTCQPYLSKRLEGHRSSYKRWKNGKSNNAVTSFNLFDEYGVENCQIILLESCSFKSIDELRAREAYYIQSNNCINRMIPNRTLKEWYSDNRDDKLKKVKEYQEQNKEKIKEYQEQNKERLQENAKLYRKQNKEKIKEYAKKYRESKKQNMI